MYKVSKKRFLEIISSFSKIKEVLVLGDLGIDKYTLGSVRRISPEAPVPILEVKKEWYKLGLAANVSENFQALGVKNRLIGTVGNDTNASILLSLMKKEKLSQEGVFKIKNRRTTFKERITAETQQICRIDYETTSSVGAREQNKVLNYFKKKMESASAVVIEDYSKGLLTYDLMQELLKICKKHKKLFLVDPGKETPAFFYKGVTFLKPNLLEAKSLAKSLGHEFKSIEDLASFLVKKLDLEMLAITLGGRGMAIWDRREKSNPFHIVESVAIDVYDVSGAGDTAISVLASSLLSGATLKEAAFIANCASSVVVGKKGTATLTLEELKNFYSMKFS